MARAGVREFLASLDQSLVDIDAVISDLAKEDCDDIEVRIAVVIHILVSIIRRAPGLVNSFPAFTYHCSYIHCFIL